MHLRKHKVINGVHGIIALDLYGPPLRSRDEAIFLCVFVGLFSKSLSATMRVVAGL